MRVRFIHAVAVLGVSLCPSVRADTYTWNFTGGGTEALAVQRAHFNNSNPGRRAYRHGNGLVCQW